MGEVIDTKAYYWRDDGTKQDGYYMRTQDHKYLWASFSMAGRTYVSYFVDLASTKREICMAYGQHAKEAYAMMNGLYAQQIEEERQPTKEGEAN